MVAKEAREATKASIINTIKNEKPVKVILENITRLANLGKYEYVTNYDEDIKSKLIILGYHVSLPHRNYDDFRIWGDAMTISWETENMSTNKFENDYNLFIEAKNKFIIKLTGWTLSNDGAYFCDNNGCIVTSAATINLNEEEFINQLLIALSNNEFLLRMIKLKAISE